MIIYITFSLNLLLAYELGQSYTDLIVIEIILGLCLIGYVIQQKLNWKFNFELCASIVLFLFVMYVNFRSFDYHILAIKIIELRVIRILNFKQRIAAGIFSQACIIFVLIYNNAELLWYALTFWSTAIIYQEPIKTNQIYIDQLLTQRRESQLLEIHEDTLTKLWKRRLQRIPVGLMIVRKDDLQVSFSNAEISLMFPEQKNLAQHIFNELSFSIMSRRSKKTSIIAKTLNQIHIPKLSTLNGIGMTLRDVLSSFSDGKLQNYVTKEGHLELSTRVLRKNGLSDEEDQRDIVCKIISFEEEPEVLVILDDITLQTQLQRLETRDRFKEKMVESFSHELRTPLNSAQLFIQAILKDKSIADSVKEKYVLPAHNVLKLQAYLIRDIIDFNQFHSGCLKFDIRDFTFEDIIEELSSVIAPIFELKKLGFQIHIKNQINPVLQSDFERVMQILINLLQNSIKNSISGTITLEVSGKDNWLEFTVIDQGMGLDQSRLRTIQEFLTNLNNTREYSDQWQGLGLLVSQILLFNLAPQNKALIRVKSKGRGCSVSFKLKTSKSFNTQIITKSTLQRTSIKSPNFTVPDLSYGIVGILKICNCQDEDIGSPRAHEIPTLIIPSQFFPDSEQRISQQFIRKNLKQSAVLDQPSIEFKPTLSAQQEPELGFEQKRRRMTIELNHGVGSILSRIQQKEEEEIQKEMEFESLHLSSCSCNVVLSVDDEIFNQLALELNLQQLGYNIKLAYNGKQALDIVEQAKPCSSACTLFRFILMDCQMPVLDGWQTTEILVDMMDRKVIPQIPIIGVTAFNGSREIDRCMMVGMKAVLGKPLKVAQLKEVLIKK